MTRSGRVGLILRDMTYNILASSRETPSIDCPTNNHLAVILHNGLVNVWHETPERAFMHVMAVAIERP